MGLRRPILSLIFCMLLDSVQSENWTHHIELDGNGIFRLSWNPPDDKRGDRQITFKVEMKTTGYFGLGFSRKGEMPGSDIVTGWIKDGQVYFQDRHADAYNLPPIDDQQDYELIRAYENDTFTVFEFRRKLDTCDENDWVIDKSTVRVIYSYSEEDPTCDDPFYHGENRGSKSVLFLRNNIKDDVGLNLTSLLQWDVTSNDVDFSKTDTLYWCKIVKSPNITEKHHIVYFKAMIQEEHKQFVHHMAFYECIGGTPEEYEHLVDGKGHECFKPGMPIEMTRCLYLTTQWAIGGDEMVLPEHVGIPLDPVTTPYYMFEIHYDNPQLLGGKIDRSGFRFYHTPELRKNEVGKIVAGVSISPRNFIVPGQGEYLLTGHANPKCITSLFPETGVKAVAISLHAHGTTQSMKVRHFRGNKELPTLYNDRHYDPYYQAYRFYTEEVTILPNDQLTIECIFNSTQRSKVTFNGPSSKDEMCAFLVVYYPRVKEIMAFSAPSYANINKVLNTSVTSEADVLRVLANYDWNSVNADEVQNALRYSQHETQCNMAPFQEDIKYDLLSYPSDLIPYEQHSTCNVTN